MTPLHRWALPDGTPLNIRPVQPHDAPQLDALITGLAPRDRAWRFHGAVNGVTPQRLRSMVTPRLPQQIALVATAQLPQGQALVADVRCALDDTGRAAEFGLMVAAGWRQRGVGQHAMAALQAAAAGLGLSWLYGSVRNDNLPMLALMQRCGFLCTPHRADARLVVVERRLTALHPCLRPSPCPSL